MQGKVQVYTGDGKGKTTAALGLALRASGADLKTYIGQFIKSGDTSEATAIDQIPNITIEHYGTGRFVLGSPNEEDIKMADEGLMKLHQAMQSGKYDIVIADEANCAVKAELFPAERLLNLIDQKPDNLELIFTGRGADQKLIDRADLVSEIQPVKHYYEKGVPSRKGIED
ncbi:cob(I)yrinic acid a,c-diamide adenosyltransferase [bacterium E08(2017)]|nr:cob(I)yrinic acid a,c-diamide adenosyltransferase [bacterium E08(2017)]